MGDHDSDNEHRYRRIRSWLGGGCFQESLVLSGQVSLYHNTFPIIRHLHAIPLVTTSVRS